MNTWDPDNASCSAPQDTYNPDRESTIAYQKDQSYEKEFEIGSWKDVYCVHNHIYYEAQIKAKRKPSDSELEEVKFHFKGWSSCFDEWIDIDSDRIQPHHLYTNPDAVRISDQEKWQGMKRPSSAATKTKKAVNKLDTKKRKSTGSLTSHPKKAKVEKVEAVVRHSYPEYMYADDFAVSDEEDHVPSTHVINQALASDPTTIIKMSEDDDSGPTYWSES